jgi:predicted RNA binding protein YcfA (HicA-like mRNA interferase family)
VKSISSKDFIRLIEARGWRLLRISGSHHIYGKNGYIERLSVPVHSGQMLKIGLLRHLMKIAEISENEL